MCWEDSLEQEMATHSSVLAWKIPLTGEPGGLPGLQSWTQCVTKHELGNVLKIHPCYVASDKLFFLLKTE